MDRLSQGYFWLGGLLTFIVGLNSMAASPSPGSLFTYEGVLTDASGTPISGSQTIAFQVLYGSCVLYSESQTLTPGAGGEFSVTIGSGTRTDNTGNTADRIFAAYGSVNCEGASAETLSGFSTRSLHIKVGSTDLSPDVTINNIPFAINAMKLADRSYSDFVNISGAITQSAVESWFASSVMGQILAGTYVAPMATSANNVSGTVAIANGGTGATTAAGARTNLGLAAIASSGSASDLSSGTVPPARMGTGTTDATTFLRGDGTWAPVPAGGVTSVAGKSGVVTLEAADITDFSTAADTRISAQRGAVSGVASLDANSRVPVAQLGSGTANGTTYLRGDGAWATVSTSDASKLPLTGGTMTGPIEMSSNNITNLGHLTMASGKSLHLSNNAADPSGLTSADKGKVWFNSSSNEIRYWNGSAAQSLGAAGSGITDLTGDVTATGSGSVVATIANGVVDTNKIADGSIAKIDLNFSGVNAATSSLMLVDSTGKFANFACVTAGDVATWSVSGWSCQPGGGGGSVASVSASSPLSSSGGAAPVISISSGSAAGQTLRWDGSSWAAAQLSAADISGLGSLALKSSVDLSTADVSGTLDASRLPALSGDVTSVAGSGATTLSNTGVTAGTYSKVTVDAKGRVTLGANVGHSDVTGALGYTPLDKAGDVMTGPLGLSSVVSDPGGLTAADQGKMWYRSDVNQVKYWDGTAAVALGAAGTGLQSLNGLTGNAQTFGLSISGTSPTWYSNGTIHTLKLPMASTAGATEGLISKTDYDNFAGKQPAGNYITGLTGDISASGPGSASAVISNNAVTSGKIFDGTIVAADMNFAGTNSASSGFVIVDSLGKFINFTCTFGQVPTWTASGWGCQTPTSTLPSLADGAIWIGDGASNPVPHTLSGDATISNTGVLTLANSGVTAGTYSRVTVNAKGRVTLGGNIISSDVTNALGFVPLNSTGGTMSGALSMNSQNQIQFGDSDSSNFIGLKAPSAVSSNYTLILPSNMGTINQVLTTDGSGNLSWSTPSGGGGLSSSTSFSGDVSGLYNTLVVNKINGVSVSGSPGGSGQVLRYDGTTSVYQPAFLGIADIKSTITFNGAFQNAGCSADQTLHWQSASDSFQCQSIANLDASVIQTGTLDIARIPANAITQWTNNATSPATISYFGNVGIGATPDRTNLGYGRVFTVAGPGTTSNDSGILELNNSNGTLGAQSGKIVFTNSGQGAGNQMIGYISTGLEGAASGNYGGNMRFMVKKDATSSGTMVNAMTIKNNGNVGVGTATPQATLDVNGHIGTTAAISPTNLTGCTLDSGSDTRGILTLGGGSSCSMTFITPYTTIPVCVVSWRDFNTTTVSFSVMTTSTVMTINLLGTGFTGKKVNYICLE